MLIPGMEWAGLMDRPGRKAPTSWTWSLINIGIDSFVATSLLPAVQSFVTEQVWMRYKYGFRPVEVVFRTPTNWEAGNLKNLTADAREHKLMDSIYEAGNNKWVHSRPGDSTWTSIWRIECKPTGAVYNALASGNADFSLDDWKLAVWRKYNGGWISWELWKINDAVGRDEYTRVFEKLKVSSSFRPEMISQLKFYVSHQENLVQRGKGDVVDRLIQIFINRPGEATLTREQEIQKLFESEGLDFAQIWNEARAAATQIPTPAPS